MSKVKKAIIRIYVPFKAVVGWLTCKLLSVCPMENKVVFSNFSGKCYGDNPRYISEKLHELAPDVKICWLQHKGYELDVPDYVEIVKWPSFGLFYHHVTAKIWVDSHSKPVYIWKRKGQYYIETWHGGLGFKKIEMDAKDQLDYGYLATTKHNVRQADLFISNCTWLSDLYRRAFLYKGDILECGYPKNDIFFQDSGDIENKVKERLHLQKNDRILLYAPTFRKGKDTSWFDLDFGRLVRLLPENENWKILIKLHPMMMKQGTHFFVENDFILDVSDYPDMQELILATDVFITDYSSAIFDFCFMRKMGFLYASDYENYEKNERGLYWDLRKLPFPFAENMDELIANIQGFHQKEYERKLEEYFELVGLKESGVAAERIVTEIVKKLDNK